MAEQIYQEDLRRRIREKLNSEKIKLWLPPYTKSSTDPASYPPELINRYASDLFISAGEVEAMFEDLRSHALAKLASRERLQNEGIAMLKVKLAGLCENMKQACSMSNSDKQVLSIEIAVNQRGIDLKQRIAEVAGISVLRLKLIMSGRVIEDSAPLHDQNLNLKCGMVMAVVLSTTEAEARKHQDDLDLVSRTVKAAEFLSSKEDGGDNGNANYYLKIADQTGKQIHLPPEERKALTLAMTLHEKGKAALRRKDYAVAVLLLLQADEQFSNCRSSILDAVDNYAILCLDIVWCYLCLKNINELPNAERRLKTCDDCFRKSYGPDLERLALIKGGTGSEKALFMRLHLLQAIIAFHKSEYSSAQQLLNRAETELTSLQVREEDMVSVMNMGFTQLEARLALRAAHGNVPVAVAHIMKRKDEKTERIKQEKEEARKKSLARKLGKTVNGSWVNTDLYKQLLEMGFAKGAAAASLRQTNNDITQAIQVLNENPDLLLLPDPETVQPRTCVTEEMIAQVTALGFPADVARAALHHFKANINTVIEQLLSRSGDFPAVWFQSLPACSSASSSGDSESSQGSQSQMEKEAIADIIPDIPEDEEHHLDLELNEEAEFLAEYRALLQSCRR